MHKTSFVIMCGSAQLGCFVLTKVKFFFSFEKHRKRESQILTLNLFPVRKMF